MSESCIEIDKQNQLNQQDKKYKKQRSKSLAQPNQTVRFNNEQETQFNKFKQALTTTGGGFLISQLNQKSNYASTVDTKPQGITTSVIDKNSKFQVKIQNPNQVNKFTQPQQTTKQEQESKLETAKPASPPKIQQVSKIDSKTIELWINNMLAEADYENRQKGKIDGLSRFGIDRKTLKTKGLSSGDVDRIFRCLFVYSFGFHEMLNDITIHTSESITTVSQIWQVFGVLLEYCARGDFLLTINELEKEKKYQLNRMEDMLTEKERRLQVQEQQERERHSKLIGEVNHLQQQRDLLIMEKTQLEVDFKQADIAFNDEVALRLKFEYRINEIHSIHRELVNKHNKLLEDFLLGRKHIERLEKEIAQSKKQYETLFVDKRSVENEVANLRVQLDGLNMTLKNREQQVRELDVKLAIVRKQENKEYFDRKDFEHQLQTLILQKNNLEVEVQSSKLMETELKQKNESLSDFKVTMSKRCQELEQDLLNYQTQYIDFHQRYQNLSKIEQQLRKQYEIITKEKLALEKTNEQLSLEKRRIEVEIQFSTSKCEIQQKEIAMLSSTIQQMKTIKAQLDDDFMRERVKVDSLSGTVSSKEEMIGELEKCLSYLQQRLHSVTTELIESENRMKLNEDDSKVQLSVMQKKIEFLESCLIAEKAEIILEREKCLKITNESDIQNQEIADLRTQFKNEVFEKNNLLTKTIFLNRVIENERQRNYELLTEHTHLKILLENAERDIKAIKIIQSEQSDLYKEEDRLVHQRFNRIIGEMKNKQNELTYRIYLEDAQSHIMRLTNTINTQNSQIDVLSNIKNELQEKIKSLINQQESLIQKVEQLKTSLMDKNNQFNKLKQFSLLIKIVFKKVSTEYSQLFVNLQEEEKINKTSKIKINKLEKEVEDLNDEIEKNQLIIKRLRRDQLVLKGRSEGEPQTMNESSKIQVPSDQESSPRKSSEKQSRKNDITGKNKAIQFVVRVQREAQKRGKIQQQGFSTPLNPPSEISTIDKVQFSRVGDGMNKTQTERLIEIDTEKANIIAAHPQSERKNRARFSSLDGKIQKDQKDENFNTFYQLQQVTEQFEELVKEDFNDQNPKRKVSKSIAEKIKIQPLNFQKQNSISFQKDETKKSQSYGMSHSFSGEQDRQSLKESGQYTISTGKSKLNQQQLRVFDELDQNQENSIEINQIKIQSGPSEQPQSNSIIQINEIINKEVNQNRSQNDSSLILQGSNFRNIGIYDSSEHKLASQSINFPKKKKKNQINKRTNSREIGRLIQNATNYYQK